MKEKETAKLYDALIVIALAIGQTFACHREGATIVEVKIVRIVIAQKQVNVQTVKDNIKFLRQTPVFKKLKNQRQINRTLQTSSSDSQNENIFH